MAQAEHDPTFTLRKVVERVGLDPSYLSKFEGG